jgi:hypothetical protein
VPSLVRRKKRLAALLAARRASAAPFDPRLVCHAKQAAMVASLVVPGLKSVCVLASRQSGKSHGAVMAALLLARDTGCNVLYVTSTRDTVNKIAFEPAKQVNETNDLGGRAVYHTIRFDSGGVVYFMGADSERSTKRLRGTPNLVACFIDEAGIYESDRLREMIETVRPGLTPRLGNLVILGTPSLAGAHGMWSDTVNNAGYEHHRFSYADNDRVDDFANVEANVDKTLAALGYTRASAYFLREYKCEFVVELSERVYQLTEANYYDGDPPANLDRFVVGGDVGVSDADALLSLGWRMDAPWVWVDDEQEASGQDALAFSQMVSDLNTKRRPQRICVDPGGGGKKTILTVRKLNPGIPIQEADKPPMAIQCRAVNMLAQSGRLKVRRGSKIAAELARATWRDGIVGGDIDEHGKHSDLVPCLRYAALAATPYLAKLDARPDPPPVADRKAEWAEIVKSAERMKEKKPFAPSVLGKRRFVSNRRPF